MVAEALQSDVDDNWPRTEIGPILLWLSRIRITRAKSYAPPASRA